MSSRRKRKRERRAVPGSAEATATGFPIGGSGGLRVDWNTASRGDLRLLAHAIRHDWPIAEEKRRPLIDAIFAILRSGAMAETDFRRKLAAAWAIIEADSANQRLVV